MKPGNLPVAFVLTGGTSLGAVQVGMLKALVSLGIEPDMVVGASVGAINGAYFVGEDSRKAVEGLDRIWRNIRRKDIFPISPKTGMLASIAKSNYTVPSSPLRHFIQEHLQYERLEEARIPIHVVTTDVLDGSEFVISSGLAVDALLASSALPGVFPPVRIGRRYLADGGIANNTPVSIAVKLGARRIIVLPTILSSKLEKPPRTAIGMAFHTFNLFVMKQLTVDVAPFERDAEIIIIPPVNLVDTFRYDFSRSAELIDASEKQTLKWIREDKKQLLPR